VERKKREVVLYTTLADKVIANVYKDSKLIICGICGNLTPEECYLADDCPHCFSGIHDEPDNDG